MIKKILPLIIILSLFVGACSSKPAPTPTKGLTKVSLPMGYIPSVQFAPFYVAKEKGYYKNEGLDVDFDYKFETDGVALVGAGKLPFALVSGEQVPLARSQGLPVVYVLSWWKDYPVAVATLANSDIKTASDILGKKVGIPGLYGASYVGLRAMLDKLGIKEDQITLDSIGFNQVEALAAGREDAVVVYANNEPIQLKAQGYPVKVFPVKDYVKLASNGIITNEQTIAENPDLVQSFVRATQKGIKDAINDPQEAYDISKKYVEGLTDADYDTQFAVLNASIDYWKSNPPGVSRPDAWENMQQVLLEMGLLKEPIDLTKAYSNQFVQ
jgi:NitT/TauT family transport system substrate-binding protein